MIEWLNHMGDKESHKQAEQIWNYVMNNIMREWTNADNPGLKPERIYHKTISSKTKAWINKRPFLTRISYIDPKTKVVNWFGTKISEKLFSHIDPNQKNLNLLMSSAQGPSFGNFIELHLDLMTGEKKDKYPQYMPPRAEYPDAPDTITDVVYYKSGSQTNAPQIYVRLLLDLAKFFLDKMERRVDRTEFIFL